MSGRFARAALVLHLLLIAGLAIWTHRAAGLLILLPLLLPLPGLWRQRGYTFAWTSMLLVFYVALLLAEGVAQPARRPVALALATLAAVEFVALVLFVRIAARERRQMSGTS